MTELKLTTEEMLRMELHYCEQRTLQKEKEILVKEKELLKNKSHIAQLIDKNAQLELIQKTQQTLEFSQTIKDHQKSYENNLKKKVMERLNLKEGQDFSYSPDTLEVTITTTNSKQTDKKKE